MNGRTLAPVLLATLSGGCLDSCSDMIELPNPTIVEVMLLHTPDLAEQFGIDSETGEITAAEVFLLQPLNSGGNSMVSGATVRLVTPDGYAVTLDEVDDGRYSANSTDKAGLFYEERGLYEVQFTIEGEAFSASSKAFVGADIAKPSHGDQIPLGEPLTVGMSEAGNAMVVLLYDQQGEEIFNSTPTTTDDMLDLLAGNEVREVTIPGVNLAEEQVYFVGAGALENGNWQDMSDNLSGGLSLFVSGALDAIAVSTAPLNGMLGVLLAVEGNPELAAQGFDIEESVQAMLYAATVDIDDGLQDVPLTGFAATLEYGSNSINLVESSSTDGLYEANSTDQPGLTYTPGQDYTFTLGHDDDTYEITMAAPDAPDLSEPEPWSYHDPSQNLVIQTPTTHDIYFVALVDANGDIVYDDFPDEDAGDLFLSGDLGTGPGEQISIPAGMFTAEGLMYGVALLGLREADAHELSDNLNQDLSGLFIGTTALTAITTVPMH